MDSPEQPPRPVPPAPPRPEWIKPASAPPPVPGVTPVVDFFQRRVENLERELALERERAMSAQSLMAHHESLKNEVDSHLKALTDQLKREKAERDNEESRSHSRGRVEALEKRLDEMNATFAQLLKDAVASRESAPASTAFAAELASLRQTLTDAAAPRESGPTSAELAAQMNATFAQLLKDAISSRDAAPSTGTLAAELSAFRATLKDGMDGVARWRGELRELSAMVPQVQGLSDRLPRDEKLFEESVGRRLDEFSARLARALEDWKRGQDAARADLDARIEAAARERGDLARMWEAQARAMREDYFKDGVARDVEIKRQVGELAARLAELASAQTAARDEAATGDDGVREGLERVLAILTSTPKAKDVLIQALEAERAEFSKLAQDRQETLRRFAAERHEVEKCMGDGLLKLTAEAEDERARTRAAQARADEAFGRVESLQARLGDLERAVADRDDRVQRLAAERDELTRSLVAEAEKVARALVERREADAAADQRLAELRRRLDEEGSRRASAEGAALDARGQMSTLAEQTARTFQERNAAIKRFAEWEKERQRLLETLRKKDEMITLLSATFQGALKKGA